MKFLFSSRFQSAQSTRLATILLLQFALGINAFSMSPILPLVSEDLALTRSAGGILVGTSMAIMAITAIPVTLLLSRFGLKLMVSLGWFLTSSMILAPLVDNHGSFLALRVALGLGMAITLPATGALIMQWFEPKRTAFMTALSMASMTIGVSIAMVSTAPLASVLGWQGALATQGVVALVGAVYWLALGGAPGKRKEEDPYSIAFQLKRAFVARSTWLMVFADSGPFGQYVALTSWLPSYYYHEFGMSLSKAGFLTGILPLIGVLAVLTGGLIAARLNDRRLFLIALGFLACLSGFGAFLLNEGWILYASLAALGIASWAYLPLIMTLPMERPDVAPEDVAMIWALLGTAGGFICIIGPFSVGWLTDTIGSYVPAFSLWALLSLSLALAGTVWPKPAIHQRARSSPALN